MTVVRPAPMSHRPALLAIAAPAAALAWLASSGCRDDVAGAYVGGWTARPSGFGGVDAGGAAGRAGAGGAGAGGAVSGSKGGASGKGGGAGAPGGVGGAAGQPGAGGGAGAPNPACGGVGTWTDVAGLASFPEGPTEFIPGVYDFACAADGHRVFVHGGEKGGTPPAVFDAWTQHVTVGTAVGNTPPRFAGAAAWDGDRVLHFGGGTSDGGYWSSDLTEYDPAKDAWTALPSAPIEARGFTTLVRAGPHFLVWGGMRSAGYSAKSVKVFASGARYDPIADAWLPMSSVGAPSARGLHAAVWTGTRLLVWGGVDETLAAVEGGGAYDPVSDLWTPLSTSGAPSPRVAFGWTWAGGRLHVWGGAPKLIVPSVSAASGALGDGASYDPLSDSWQSINPVGAPAPRSALSIASDGTRLLVWGGQAGGDDPFPQGALYDLETQKWTPASRCIGAELLVDEGRCLSFLGSGFFAAGGRDPQARWFVAP